MTAEIEFTKGRMTPHFLAVAGRRGRSSVSAFDSCETENVQRIEGWGNHAAPTEYGPLLPAIGLVNLTQLESRYYNIEDLVSFHCTLSLEFWVGMQRAFSFPATVERSRTKERLEASLAGLCELELRRQRQEGLVLGALALGDPLAQDGSRGELACFSSWGQENLTLRRQLVRSSCRESFTACLDHSHSQTVLPHPS